MSKVLFAQLVMMKALDMQRLGFGVFVSWHGHVRSVDVKITVAPDKWQDEYCVYKIDWYLDHVENTEKALASFVSDMAVLSDGVANELH